MDPLTNYWIKFRELFIEELENNQQHLPKAWQSETDRTAFYTTQILPNVAHNMGLIFEQEFLNIDYIFNKQCSGGSKVPLVAIESENKATKAHHEVRKLCCISTPLKVLITCVEWEIFGHKNKKNQLLGQWKKQITCHNKVWPQPSVLGILVAEKDQYGTFRCYGTAFSSSGNVIDNHKILCKI